MNPDALIPINQLTLNDMKTINQIKKEEEDLRREIRTADHRGLKRIQRRLELLKICRIYLETKPNEQSLKSQLSRLNETIKINEERFAAWSAEKTGGGTELKRQYDAITEKSKLRSQIRTLEYLLT